MTLDAPTTRFLSRAAKSATTAVAKRDALIVEAVREGGGVREVARAVGMNHTSVLHIVKRESAVSTQKCPADGCERTDLSWGVCPDHFDDTGGCEVAAGYRSTHEKCAHYG